MLSLCHLSQTTLLLDASVSFLENTDKNPPLVQWSWMAVALTENFSILSFFSFMVLDSTLAGTLPHA